MQWLTRELSKKTCNTKRRTIKSDRLFLEETAVLVLRYSMSWVGSNTGTGSHWSKLLFIIYMLRIYFIHNKLIEFMWKICFLFICDLTTACLLAGNYQWRINLLTFLMCCHLDFWPSLASQIWWRITDCFSILRYIWKFTHNKCDGSPSS